MLEFDFRLHAPSLAEVIPQVDDRMRDVEAPVGGVACILFGTGIAVDIVAEKVPRVGGLTVPADGKLLGGKGAGSGNQNDQGTNTSHWRSHF